jgi:glycosyltransferase involved in cell wall biosynthesis
MTGKRPLKVLVLGQDPDVFERPGGAPNDTRQRHLGYARELLRRRPGSELRIAVHTRAPHGDTYEKPFEGLELFGTRSSGRLTAPLDLLRIVRRFRRDGWIPDVISCQSAYEEGIIALLARDPRSRVQMQVHSDPYGLGFRRESILNFMKGLLTRFAIRRADHVRTVSAGAADALVGSKDIPPFRVEVAPVPVSFASLPRCPDPVSPLVLFVGRLSPEKDLLGTWIDTARRIHQRVPGARFLIAGDGSERTSLKQAIARSGCPVSLPGAVPYDDLPALFARASVFLFTSHYEGLGRVVVEAMMSGVPVVSTDIVGPRDLIDDGRTGYLVARDPAALADRCVSLIDDLQSARRIGAAAQVWARSNYSFEAVVARLVAGWETAADLERRGR